MPPKSTYDIIVEAYPEVLTDHSILRDQIELQDDSDGLGIWIVKWDYEKPLPEGLKIGK